jgi:hypothetical protein
VHATTARTNATDLGLEAFATTGYTVATLAVTAPMVTTLPRPLTYKTRPCTLALPAFSLSSCALPRTFCASKIHWQTLVEREENTTTAMATLTCTLALLHSLVVTIAITIARPSINQYLPLATMDTGITSVRIVNTMP